ncbi:hypothetical protein [Sphingobium sp. D43FB]|uniref:hypothetical protein n=1 Tax=Sphingobium sp. D43FB TaxID=2017595 RepID=UPI001144D125|nr:hypothetical protein [Sphingobium sp. D43FB]
MVNRINIFVVSAYVLLSSAPAQAAGDAGTFYITEVSVEGGGATVYVRATGISNPDSCSSSTRMSLVAINSEIQDRMLATALTAKASGKRLGGWLNGCVSSPWGTIPQAVNVSLRD